MTRTQRWWRALSGHMAGTVVLMGLRGVVPAFDAPRTVAPSAVERRSATVAHAGAAVADSSCHGVTIAQARVALPRHALTEVTDYGALCVFRGEDDAMASHQLQVTAFPPFVAFSPDSMRLVVRRQVGDTVTLTDEPGIGTDAFRFVVRPRGQASARLYVRRADGRWFMVSTGGVEPLEAAIAGVTAVGRLLGAAR